MCSGVVFLVLFHRWALVSSIRCVSTLLGINWCYWFVVLMCFVFWLTNMFCLGFIVVCCLCWSSDVWRLIRERFRWRFWQSFDVYSLSDTLVGLLLILVRLFMSIVFVVYSVYVVLSVCAVLLYFLIEFLYCTFVFSYCTTCCTFLLRFCIFLLHFPFVFSFCVFLL